MKKEKIQRKVEIKSIKIKIRGKQPHWFWADAIVIIIEMRGGK